MQYIINFGGYDATKTEQSFDTVDIFKVTENDVEKVNLNLTLEPARHDTVSATAGVYTLVMGGTNHEAANISNAIDIFKTTINGVEKFNHSLTLSVARTDLAAASAGNYIFAMGGSTSSGLSDAVDVFEVSSGGVTKYEPKSTSSELKLSEPRCVLTAASAKNHIFAMGGMKRGGYSSTVDVFRVTDSKVEKAEYSLALSEPRAFLSSAAIDKYILAIGGSAGSSNHYKTIDVFEVTSNGVVKVENHGLELSVGRNILATAVIDNYVIAMGGYDGTKALDTVDVFEISNGNFKIVTDHGLNLRLARAYLAAASAGNYIFAMGGIFAKDSNGKSIPTNVVDVFQKFSDFNGKV